MFAGDINVLISASDERLVQIKTDRLVAALEIWFNRNDLVINAGKAGAKLFHNKQTHVLVKSLVTFNNMSVDYTAEIKFPGIQISDTLKWHSHVQLLAGKLCKVTFVIKSLKGVLSPNLIRNISFTKFHSLLQFGILLWVGAGAELLLEYLEFKTE